VKLLFTAIKLLWKLNAIEADWAFILIVHDEHVKAGL
jgi:hypothetical protein